MSRETCSASCFLDSELKGMGRGQAALLPFSGVTLMRPSTLPLVNERRSRVSLSGSVVRSPAARVNDASKQLNMSTMCIGGTRSWREGVSPSARPTGRRFSLRSKLTSCFASPHFLNSALRAFSSSGWRERSSLLKYSIFLSPMNTVVGPAFSAAFCAAAGAADISSSIPWSLSFPVFPVPFDFAVFRGVPFGVVSPGRAVGALLFAVFSFVGDDFFAAGGIRLANQGPLPLKRLATELAWCCAPHTRRRVGRGGSHPPNTHAQASKHSFCLVSLWRAVGGGPK